MRQRRWLSVLVAAWMTAQIAPVRGETRPGEATVATVDTARLEDLRQEFTRMREAYLKWAESEARTAMAAGLEHPRAGRRVAGLEYRYHRLQSDMRRLSADSGRRLHGSRTAGQITVLRDQARDLALALQAMAGRNRRLGTSAEGASGGASARPAPRSAVSVGPEATPPRESFRTRSPRAAGGFAHWAAADPDLDASSYEYQVLRRAEVTLAGLQRYSAAELCRRGRERRLDPGAASAAAQTRRRDRLDAYSRLVPSLAGALARVRDSASDDDTGARIARAADQLLAALRPYDEALRGCQKSGRGLCGREQSAEVISPPAGALQAPTAATPANDTCATATAISSGSFSGDTTDAGSDGEASCGASGASPDVWYRYTAPATGTILFSTLGSAYDTVLSIHGGCPGDIASELACNDDWAGGQSQISYDVTAGEDYLVRVSGFGGDAGAYALSVGPPGSISGQITVDQPWLVNVDIYDAGGTWITNGWSVTGTYTVADLPAGDYFALTWNQGGYIDQLYAEPDNLPCPFGSCALASGTPIPVSLGSDTGGVDFELELGASIGGTVTDDATGDPLDAEVSIYDTAGNYLVSDWTGGNPTYGVAGLPTGSYLANTWNWDSYLDELYDNLPCPLGECDVSLGTPISVTAPVATLGIDFALAKGGSISGQLVDALTGLPVDGTVEIYDATTGEHLANGWPDELGDYSTESGLATGTYFARSVNWDGWVDELYDDLPCPGGCEVTAGTPISVTTGSDTGGVDFVLKKEEGAIAGRVTDGVTGSPIPNVRVEIYDSGGGYLTDSGTDEDGYYLSYDSLPAGTYHALTYNEEDYQEELWEEIDCSGGCDPTTGTDIVVTTYVLGIDFTLEKSGAITGQVTDAATAAPLAGVWVSIYDSGGGWVADAYTDAAGNYISPGSLAPGDYYAHTYNEQGYLDELYDDIDCSSGCDPTTGTEIVVSSYATSIDFALAKGGAVAGAITDDATGAPLAGVEVAVYKLEPWGTDWATWAVTDAAGEYASARPLVTGSYVVRTDVARTGTSYDYIDELYDVGYCLGWCDLAAGTPIAVTGGVTTPGIDFGLDRGSVVSGQVTDAATGAPISGAAGVSVFDLDRNWVAEGWTDQLGRYTTRPGLPSGSYFAHSKNWWGYINELYDDIVCAGCESWSLLGGTPIALSAPLEASGIDFALERGAQVTGTVHDQATGDPLGGPAYGWCVWVDVYARNHRWVTRGHPNSNWGGWYSTDAGLPPGTYYALSENWCGYATEAWDGLACPWAECDLPETTPITVTSTADATGIHFYLDGRGSIAGQVTAEGSANPLQAELYVFDASGRAVWGEVWSDPSTGDYSTPDDLCAGDYFVRTVNTDGLVDEVYDDIPCAGCDPASGTPVVVSGGPVGGVDFALAAGGSISGQVTDAADGSPLPGVAVLFVNPATGWAATYSETDGSGMYATYGGLASGSYYVTTGNEYGFVDELYDGVVCPGPLEFTWRRSCALADGTLVAVTSPTTTSGIDFALDAGGGIAGTVRSALTGEPVGCEVWIYDSTGTFIEEVSTDTGDYASATGLAAGSYYAHTLNWEGHPDECYQDVPCPIGLCDPTTGTAIPVAAGTTTFGIDFALGSFTCDPLPSLVTVTGSIDHPAMFLSCSEIVVHDCQIGPNGEVGLVAGQLIVMEDNVTVEEGAELTVRIQQ